VTAGAIWFDPPPRAADLPERFPSPFVQGAPHPLARRAADELVADLQAGVVAAGIDFTVPGGGKMFGVLIVADGDGRIGALRAFSGMIGDRWIVDGFVPPVFDLAARDAFWPAGEAELAELDAQIRALANGAERDHARATVAALEKRHRAAWDEMRGRHRANRHARRARRRQLERGDRGPFATGRFSPRVPLATGRYSLDGTPIDAPPDDVPAAPPPQSPDVSAREAELYALDQASRADTAERRRLIASTDAEHADTIAPLRAIDDQIAALEQRKSARSRELLAQIHDTYWLASARGERRPLRAVFAPDAPPGGAGDCAGPKLLAEAYRRGWKPIALAELWWGAPPATGGRTAGNFYPACRGKCGPILGFMLDGLPHDPAPVYGAAPIDPAEPRTVYEDDWLIVVDKPCGLLSVPGRTDDLEDSVYTRLRRRFGPAAGPLVVHRLDLDTSGLLLAAKDPDTHAVLQRLFERREIDKRYIAWLAGIVERDHGVVELALRVDLDDRPRQIHDPVNGKPAITEWRVLERSNGRTRVEMIPRTGRTHQLRLHAAHPLGIGVPIVGDPLYGDGDDGRLMLHAESIAFAHPRAGRRIEVASPAPF
jgi:tRNA pseudouridine32 synthase / 23S rRNA pseudouridine746 synthase